MNEKTMCREWESNPCPPGYSDTVEGAVVSTPD